jgi:hypothetical protein
MEDDGEARWNVLHKDWEKDLTKKDIDNSSESTKKSRNESKVLSSYIVVHGFPSDMPTLSKERMLVNFYENASNFKWINENVIVFSFSSEAKAKRFMTKYNKSILTISLLQDCLGHTNFDAYIEGKFFKICILDIRNQIFLACEEMYDSIKPEIDSRAAARMIRSSLGIKTPVGKTSKPASNTRESSPPRLDAWDA